MCQCLLCASMFSRSNFVVENIVHFNETIVQIHKELRHRHVLHSHSIRVFDAYFPPQEASLFHSHEKDSVFICLDGGNVTNEFPGKTLVPRPPITTGEIYYRPYAATPIVHRIKNLSSTPFRILDIEILSSQNTSVALNQLPDMFQIVLENDRIRVSKLRLLPNQSTGNVLFSKPRLLVVTEEGKILISSESQSNKVEAARGYLDMQELEHHENITNVGDIEVEIVFVEVK